MKKKPLSKKDYNEIVVKPAERLFKALKNAEKKKKSAIGRAK